MNLADLTPADIQSLIDSEVAENLTLEYKQTLPAGGTDQKREFIYDIAALANQAGGDIVYGVVDRRGQDNQSTGVAERLTEMAISNVQTEIARPFIPHQG
jgi:predicted HTH transcriptional regulator